MNDRIALLESQIQERNNAYQQNEGRYQALVEELAATNKDLDEKQEKVKVFNNALLLLQHASNEARQQGKARIEAVVTHALQFVFGAEVSFEIELYESAGRPQAEFYMVTDVAGEKIMTQPLEANGGGVVDIISLALRIAILELQSTPAISGPIILDEPGKHISADYVDKMASLLQEMSRYFGRQILIVTHQNYLAEVADKSIEVRKVGSEAQVTDIIR